MAVDVELLKEAGFKMMEDYGKPIMELGYLLTYGITKVDDAVGLGAIIVNNLGDDLPDNKKAEVEEIIKSNYTFKGQDIPVKVMYHGPAEAQ